MLANVSTNDFIAVGKKKLDQKRLPPAAMYSGGGDSPTASDKQQGRRGKRTKRDLGRGGKAPLPRIEPSSERGSSDTGRSAGDSRTEASGMSGYNPLPAIAVMGADGEGELNSSSHLVGADVRRGPAEARVNQANELMDAADGVDKVHGSERDRQRRAHQERMATRQKHRQANQVIKIEAYAEGAEKVESRIDAERERQRKAFEQRLGTRVAKTGSGDVGGPAVAGSPREVAAATKIQATYRGYQVRSKQKNRKKKGKDGRRKKKKKKAKDKRSGGGGGDGNVDSGEVAAGSVAKGDPNNPMTTSDLLKVNRIPTPDLSISEADMTELQNSSATKVQKAYRGYRVRKSREVPPLRKARLERERREQEQKEAQKRADADALQVAGAGSKKPSGRVGRGPSKKKIGETGRGVVSSPEGVTEATQLERQSSRFSHKGIEDRRLVEEAYEIGDKIGDGNFAVVKKCVHRGTGILYALKIIDKSKTRGAKETKMIENEVKTMRAIKHPNCVNLYDVYDTPDELFLVMELVEGGDLFDRIVEKGKYQESDAIRLVRNMATALEHMHSKNIIHRDLKPENLLVTKDSMGRDTIKLADFGLSMKIEGPLKTICGTPTYVAPEIIAETPEGYGLEVDLWATGVIAYIMLCGFPPFASASKVQKDLFKKIKLGKFTFPSPYWDGISENAKDLVRKLLVVEPGKRYTAAQLLAHPWIANEATVATDLS